MPAEQPDNNKPERPLPPELAFIEEAENLPPMDDEEFSVWARGFLQKVRDNAQLMRQYGGDPDSLINQLLRFESADREVDEAQEKLLHAAADEANAARALVDQIEKVVHRAADEKPFDPQIQEWVDDLKEIRKQYPKID